MSFSSELLFYPETAREALLDRYRGTSPPPGWTEALSRPLTWTEPVGPTACGTFIVNTMLNRRVYHNPKVVDIRGCFVTIEVTFDPEPSGTLRRLETQYIMIMPEGTLDVISTTTACP